MSFAMPRVFIFFIRLVAGIRMPDFLIFPKNSPSASMAMRRTGIFTACVSMYMESAAESEASLDYA
jgi:hypothetical protein